MHKVGLFNFCSFQQRFNLYSCVAVGLPQSQFLLKTKILIIPVLYFKCMITHHSLNKRVVTMVIV